MHHQGQDLLDFAVKGEQICSRYSYYTYKHTVLLHTV